VNSVAHTALGSCHSSKTRQRSTVSGMEQGTQCRTVVPPDRRAVSRPSPTCGTETTPSLSSAYKKEKANRSFLPRCRFSPNVEVRPTTACRRLAADWPVHWTIPFAKTILIPLLSFCPSFWDHRSTTPTFAADHASDFRRHR
jgi:hypothetical protein